MDLIDALVCEAPGELRLEQRAAPMPKADEVLVRPRRVGICGTDYHIFEGKHPFLNYPRVMGHELAVEVLKAPHGSGWEPGEICVVNPYVSCGECVACRRGKANCCVRIAVLGVHRDGGMASQLTLPGRNLVRAQGLSIDACATVEFLSIGAHAVRRGQVTKHDKVLVIGAGPIGLGVALFASIANATVTVMDLSDERLASAIDLLGARGVEAAEPNAVMDESFDAVFDATGNQASIENGFRYVAHGGRYVLVSVVKDRISFGDPDFHRREMSLFGSRNATQADFNQVVAAIKRGQVPVDRLITHRTSLADAVTQLPLWATRKDGLIKAVIAIDT
jgi:2-desacetyl-2-hydroxyethyl bacteriochlorophyllide A dehydrogenase